MPSRKPFLVRMDPRVLEALQRWAAEDLRSLNGQMEFLLRRLLRESGRLGERSAPPGRGKEERDGAD